MALDPGSTSVAPTAPASGQAGGDHTLLNFEAVLVAHKAQPTTSPTGAPYQPPLTEHGGGGATRTPAPQAGPAPTTQAPDHQPPRTENGGGGAPIKSAGKTVPEPTTDGTAALATALPIAGVAVAADGPLPFGDAVGLVILGGAAIYTGIQWLNQADSPSVGQSDSGAEPEPTTEPTVDQRDVHPGLRSAERGGEVWSDDEVLSDPDEIYYQDADGRYVYVKSNGDGTNTAVVVEDRVINHPSVPAPQRITTINGLTDSQIESRLDQGRWLPDPAGN